jgi:hypothetical protein
MGIRLPLASATLLLLLNAPAFPADETEPGKAEQRFDVQEYRVIGNTVLTGRDIEGLLYPLLGLNKTIKDVEAARTALTTFRSATSLRRCPPPSREPYCTCPNCRRSWPP